MPLRVKLEGGQYDGIVISLITLNGLAPLFFRCQYSTGFYRYSIYDLIPIYSYSSK
jgi:hypothetical protein